MGRARRVAAALEIVFTRAAASDLAWIRSYISHFNLSAARRMADQIRAASIGLAEFPERGRLRSDGARELIAVHPYHHL